MASPDVSPAAVILMRAAWRAQTQWIHGATGSRGESDLLPYCYRMINDAAASLARLEATGAVARELLTDEDRAQINRAVKYIDMVSLPEVEGLMRPIRAAACGFCAPLGDPTLRVPCDKHGPG